jgi:hypothetical protein
MLLGATLLGAILTLAGCAKPMVYLLPDGRVPSSDPMLSRQFAADTATCNDERARSVQGGDHGDGSSTRGAEVDQVGDECMADKGYVLVPQDQVADMQRKLAAGAAAPERN